VSWKISTEQSTEKRQLNWIKLEKDSRTVACAFIQMMDRLRRHSRSRSIGSGREPIDSPDQTEKTLATQLTVALSSLYPQQFPISDLFSSFALSLRSSVCRPPRLLAIPQFDYEAKGSCFDHWPVTQSCLYSHQLRE